VLAALDWRARLRSATVQRFTTESGMTSLRFVVPLEVRVGA